METIEDDDGLKTEIRASIDKQTELLETEQKVNQQNKEANNFNNIIYFCFNNVCCIFSVVRRCGVRFVGRGGRVAGS